MHPRCRPSARHAAAAPAAVEAEVPEPAMPELATVFAVPGQSPALMRPLSTRSRLDSPPHTAKTVLWPAFSWRGCSPRPGPVHCQAVAVLADGERAGLWDSPAPALRRLCGQSWLVKASSQELVLHWWTPNLDAAAMALLRAKHPHAPAARPALASIGGLLHVGLCLTFLYSR